MRRRTRSIAATALAAAGLVLIGQTPTKPPTAARLPALGTRLAPLPAGAMKSVADQACLNCHASDIVRQQRLTEKQWTAEVNKMIGWGAIVPEDKKDALVAYLVEHFGPDNDRFEPVVAAPARGN